MVEVKQMSRSPGFPQKTHFIFPSTMRPFVVASIKGDERLVQGHIT